MRREELANAIEHTLLKPEAAFEDIEKLCEKALEHGFAGVCVNPCHVREAARLLGGVSRPPSVMRVAGFQLGAHLTSTKEGEARRAMDDGASEIDMEVNLAALRAGDRTAVRREIEALARVVHGRLAGGVLKVILETGALHEEQIVLGCRCCAEGEADFVKTSTGMHAAGGATVEHVRLLHKHAAPIRVKASGGIRTAAQADAMLRAGAARIGTSSGVAIMREWRESSSLTGDAAGIK